MPTFTPPTVDEAPAGTGRLFSRYKLTRGISVVKVNGHFVEKRYPSLLDLEGLTDGTDYFLGGHIYTISAGVAAGLITDGFSAYVTGGDTYFDSYLEIY